MRNPDRSDGATHPDHMIVITYSATAATNQSAQTQMDASPLPPPKGRS